MKKFLPILLLLFVLPAHATHVQGTKSDYASRSSIALAFTSNNTAGNMIVVLLSGANNNTIAISDSQGNSYTQIFCSAFFASTNMFCGWYALNIKAGANTVTTSWVTAETSGLAIAEYSNIRQVSAVDQNPGQNTNTGVGYSDVGGTTTKNHETWITLVGCANGISTITGGVTAYQQIQSGGTTFAQIADGVDKAIASFNINGNCVMSGKWLAGTTTFFAPALATPPYSSFLAGP